MDHYLDLLIDPIEIDENPTKKKLNNAYPDEFRKYLFNMKKFIPSDNISEMAKITKTDLKYWYNTDTLVDILVAEMHAYDEMPFHSLPKCLNGYAYLTQDLKKYYNNIYNLADIIISTFWSNNNLAGIIVRLMKITINKNIRIRLIFYLSGYVVKTFKSQQFINTTIKKLEEFAKEPTIDDIFTQNEIINYLKYFNEQKIE